MAKEKSGGGIALADFEAVRAERDQLKKQLAARAHPDFTQEQADRVGGRLEDGGMALGEALLFNEGSDKLKPEAFRILDSLIAILKKDYPDETIVIEGHTDNQPVKIVKNVFPENMSLGWARAHAVFKYLMDQGVPEGRMIVSSYSYNKPLDPRIADTKDGRRENRRVVVKRGGSQI